MNIWTALKSFLKTNGITEEDHLKGGISDVDYLKCFISEEDNLHAIHIWNMFKTNIIGDYQDFVIS